MIIYGEEIMRKKIVLDYQEIANAMSCKLQSPKGNWKVQYKKYLPNIRQHAEYLREIGETITCEFPFKLYLNWSERTQISENQPVPFQIRYKGNKIGVIQIDHNLAPVFSPTAENNELVNVQELEKLKGCPWDDELQKKLQEIVNKEYGGYPEHQFESWLLENLRSKEYEAKIVPYSKPVSWYDRGACYQFPTPWKGSNFSSLTSKEKDTQSIIDRIKMAIFLAMNLGAV